MKFGSSDYFRKHKKWIFALLTLMAMFVFIVGDSVMARGGSGGSNVGTRVHNWIYGEEGAFLTAGGKAMGPESIGPMLFRRQSAFSLIATVEQYGWIKEAQALGLNESEVALLARIRGLDPYRRQMAFGEPWAQNLRQKLEELAKNNNEGLYRLMGNPDSLSHQALQGLTGDPISPSGAAEFLYWKERADQMGLNFPPAKVLADLLVAGRGHVHEADIVTMLRNERSPFKINEMLAAVGDEMRVMVARGIVLGSSKQSRSMMLFNQTPSSTGVTQVTPMDLWEGYVQLKTQLEVGILPIKVFSKEFVDPVPTPSLEELQAFYQKHKDQFESETLDTPGFKLPQLFRIEFIHANLRETMPARKHYEQLMLAMEHLDPVAFFAEVYGSYRNRLHEFRVQESAIDVPLARGKGGWARLQVGLERPMDRVFAAHVVAGITASIADGLGAGLVPFLPVSAPLVRSVPKDHAAALAAAEELGLAFRVATGAPAWSAGLGLPRPVMIDMTTPFMQLLARLQYDVREDRIRSLVAHDLDQLRKDMDAYQKRYIDARNKFRSSRRSAGAKFEPPLFDEKAKITWEAHLQNFCQKRGFVYDGMKEMRPAKTLLVEQGSTPLATHLKPMFVPRLVRLGAEQIDQQIVNRLTAADGVLRPAEILPDTPGGKWLELALYWQAERAEERVPSFDECQKQVRDAWFLDKARGPAQENAEKLAAEARKMPDGYRVLVDRPAYRGNQLVERFELAATGLNYQPAKVPVVEHPPADFVSRAQRDLQKPGDVMVIWNQPRTYVYVVQLRERREPRADDPKAREEFDFKVIVPDPSRQIMVAGMPFPMWVQNEKAEKQQKEWTQFIRAHMKFDEAAAAKANEQLRSWLRDSRSE